MKIRVENFKGIRSADIDIKDGISLVMAQNGDASGHGGKTSLSQAIGCAMTRLDRPESVGRKTNDQLAQLVRGGAKQALVEVSESGNRLDCRWSHIGSHEIGMNGSDVPKMSKSSCGLSSVLGKKPEDRIKIFMQLIKQNPTSEDFEKAFADAGIKLDFCSNIKIYEIEELWNQCTTLLTKRRGRWEQCTGEKRFGINKAEGWVPDGFIDSPLDVLEVATKKASEEYRNAVANSALAENKRSELELFIKDMDLVEKKIPGLESSLKALKIALEESEKALDKIPAIEKNKTYQCPECKAIVEVYGDVLKKPSVVIGDQEVVIRKKERDAICDSIKKLNSDIYGIEKELRESRSFVKKASVAKVDLEKKPESGMGVDEAEKNLKNSIAAVSARKTYDESRKILGEIKEFMEVEKILSPTGLRFEKSSATSLWVSRQLTKLSDVVGWGSLEFTSEGNVLFNGRQYENLCENEKYRVDRIFQILIAKINNDPFIIIDRVDVLLHDLKVGLFEIIKSCGISALCMCSVLSTQYDKMVSAYKGLVGSFYKIDNGIVSEV